MLPSLHLLISFFLAVLGLPCCLGSSPVAVHGLLSAVLPCCGAQAPGSWASEATAPGTDRAQRQHETQLPLHKYKPPRSPTQATRAITAARQRKMNYGENYKCIFRRCQRVFREILHGNAIFIHQISASAPFQAVSGQGLKLSGHHGRALFGRGGETDTKTACA